LFAHSNELLMRSEEAHKTAENIGQRIATLLKKSNEFCKDAQSLLNRRPVVRPLPTRRADQS